MTEVKTKNKKQAPDWEQLLAKELYNVYNAENIDGEKLKLRILFEYAQGTAEIEMTYDYVLKVLTSRSTFSGLPKPFDVGLTCDNIRRVVYGDKVIFCRKYAPTDYDILKKYQEVVQTASERRVPGADDGLGRTARALGISLSRCKKALLEYGVLENPYKERISALIAEGKTYIQIAQELGISKSSVGLYAPYQRKAYKTNPTANACLISKTREKKKLAEQPLGKLDEESFAKRLQAELERTGMTKKAFSKKLGVSTYILNRWLKGIKEPSIFDQGAILKKTGRLHPRNK